MRHRASPYRTALTRPYVSLQTTRTADANVARMSGLLDDVRILLVEDDEDTCAVMETCLTIEGAEVCPVPDAEHALAAVRTFKPTVFVIDRKLPGMDGLELLPKLRQERGCEHVPAALVTGYWLASDRNVAEAAGFECAITKPVGVESLAKTLAWLARGGAARGEPQP